MPRRARQDDYASAFGKALDEQLSRTSLRQADLARATSVSPAYINRMMTGSQSVSPRWADLVADVLKATPNERAKLHRAAAEAAGYKLTLSDE